MKIFAHRQNDWKPGNEHGVYGAEIDVQVSDRGEIVAKHDPCFNPVPPVKVSYIVENAGFGKFFVDIKQNLDLDFLEKIVDAFGDKLHGLFDVPMPAAYYALRANLPIYQRLSEFEPRLDLGNKYWLDPLMSCTSWKYQRLLSTVPDGGKVIICSPELHGQTTIVEVWNWLLERLEDKDARIEGLVTKAPDRALKFFEGYV
jgi:hypothetical protein